MGMKKETQRNCVSFSLSFLCKLITSYQIVALADMMSEGGHVRRRFMLFVLVFMKITLGGECTSYVVNPNHTLII